MCIVIQARLGSTRLPGKSMMLIEGKPMLGHVIDRLKLTLEAIIVATPDIEIAHYAEQRGIHAYVGSETDVLDRYYHAAKGYGSGYVVRVCSDNPFCDPQLIREMLKHYWRHDLDYVSNTIRKTYPLGLDAEVFSFHVLERAWKEAKDPYEREHVTPYIYRHPELFRLHNFELKRDISHLRWCVDTQEDMDYVRSVYARLKDKPMFTTEDILNLDRTLA